MMPPFVVFPTNRIAHFVEVSLYLFYLAQQVNLHFLDPVSFPIPLYLLALKVGGLFFVSKSSIIIL